MSAIILPFRNDRAFHASLRKVEQATREMIAIAAREGCSNYEAALILQQRRIQERLDEIGDAWDRLPSDCEVPFA